MLNHGHGQLHMLKRLFIALLLVNVKDSAQLTKQSSLPYLVEIHFATLISI